MNIFKSGQKWISNAEPELGMGQILAVEHRRITVSFPASNEVRTYTAEQAPLSRVKFNQGDTLEFNDGSNLLVARVSEADGLITYHSSDEEEKCETELSDDIHFSNPQDRLLTFQVDDNS